MWEYVYRFDGWIMGLDELNKGDFWLSLMLTILGAKQAKQIKHTILMIQERVSTGREINAVDTLIRDL